MSIITAFEETCALRKCEKIIELNLLINYPINIGYVYFSYYESDILIEITKYVVCSNDDLNGTINVKNTKIIRRVSVIPGLNYYKSIAAYGYEYINTRTSRALRRVLLKVPGLERVFGISDITVICLETGSGD